MQYKAIAAKSASCLPSWMSAPQQEMNDQQLTVYCRLRHAKRLQILTFWPLGWLGLGVARLTQRSLLQQVQVAGEEVASQRVVQVEGHAVAAHGVVRPFPSIPEGLVSTFILKVGRCGVAVVSNGDLHFSCCLFSGWRSEREHGARLGLCFSSCFYICPAERSTRLSRSPSDQQRSFSRGRHSGRPSRFTHHLLGTLTLQGRVGVAPSVQRLSCMKVTWLQAASSCSTREADLRLLLPYDVAALKLAASSQVCIHGSC